MDLQQTIDDNFDTVLVEILSNFLVSYISVNNVEQKKARIFRLTTNMRDQIQDRTRDYTITKGDPGVFDTFLGWFHDADWSRVYERTVEIIEKGGAS